MRKIIVLITLSILTGYASAQNSSFPASKMAIVITKNNTHFIGEILLNNDSIIELKINGIEQKSFKKDLITFYKELNENDLIIKNKYIYPCISNTNYFISTSAFTLENKKISIKSSFLFYNDLQIALTKNIDLGFSTILGAPLTVTIKGKYSFGPSLHAAIKGFASWASYIDVDTELMAFQALLTNGNQEKNISFGPGIGLLKRGDEKIQILFSTFGLKSRVSQKFSLVAEWIFGKEIESNSLLGIFSGMLGFQHHWKKNIVFSTAIGTIGYQELIYQYRLSPRVENQFGPMGYIGFQKSW